MATILRDIVNDIIKDLKQTVDDAEINEVSVAYWTIIIANRLRGQHIDKRTSGTFLSTTTLPIQGSGERKYIELPGTIYSFNMDAGVEFISYYRPECPPDYPRVLFHRTTPSEVNVRFRSTYMKPSAANPYWWREKNKINLLGLGLSDASTVEIGLYLTLPSIREVDIDAPLDVPDEHIVMIKRHVVDLGRMALMVPREKLYNDGSPNEGPQQVVVEKQTSVNDPITNPGTEFVSE